MYLLVNFDRVPVIREIKKLSGNLCAWFASGNDDKGKDTWIKMARYFVEISRNRWQFFARSEYRILKAYFRFSKSVLSCVKSTVERVFELRIKWGLK